MTAEVALPTVVGLLWGITNPFIARGVRIAGAHPARQYTGLSALDSLLHHFLTPAFLLPQALNLCGSVLFAAALGSGNISLAVPVANGVSLAANAVFDHLLGDRLARLHTGIPGILLVFVGATLCTLALQQQQQHQQHQQGPSQQA